METTHYNLSVDLSIDKVYIQVLSELCKISNLFIFENSTFDKYVDLTKPLGQRINYEQLKLDIANIIGENWGSIPYTTEEIANDLKVYVNQGNIKFISEEK